VHWSRVALTGIGAVLLMSLPSQAQQIPSDKRVFNEQLLRTSGQPVVPLYEGWFPNADGTYGICFGYFNLNTEEPVDIPLGPNNFIEPAEFDGLQPTHFDPVPAAGYRRHFCVFTVTVPEDFGEGRVVWTLRRDGEALSTPGKLIGPYVLDEPNADARGVVAPVLKLDADGRAFQGRTGLTASSRRSAVVGQPLALTVWVEHPAPTSWVGWSKHQGPGVVEFDQPELLVDRVDGTATTTARFSEPGRYLLRVQSIYSTTSFEYHCCWTNGYVPVDVTR
jgi:hypothetical protein